MSLVIKVKFQDSLRRWVVYEAVGAGPLTVTIKELDAKIRELFRIPPSASLAVTYTDKDNDVVTIADDQDLFDACMVQRLNPLRLDVKVLADASGDYRGSTPFDPKASPVSAENMNLEALLHALPQATADVVKAFLDPELPVAACLGNVETAFKQLVNNFGQHHGCHEGQHHGRHPRHHHGHHRRPHHEHHHQHHHENSCEHPYTHRKPGENPPHHANRHPGPPPIHPHREETTIHWGVECDGCGISPIEGSRYKSSKKNDFDLCESCFKDMGKECDYLKLDEPVHHPPLHSPYPPPSFRRGPKPFVAASGHRTSFAQGVYGWKPSQPFLGHQSSRCSPSQEHKKLDARFVKDVTIFDGMELAPGTKFTKIWRMSNIGTLPWPQGICLVHIGGDVLGTEKAVVVKLPESGLPCGEEVEVSVDLIAPEKAGRYVSHWRLLAPSGQKFGHRVWVVIHVVDHGEHSPQFQASLPTGESIIETGEGAMDLGNEPGRAGIIDVDPNGAEKLVVDVVVDGQTAVVEQALAEKSGFSGHENNTSIVYPDPTSLHIKEDNVEKSKFGVDGFSLVEKPSEGMEWFDVSDQANSPFQILESLGFTDYDLNISVLQRCNFDLGKAVDDLVVRAGWDGVMKDLEEMGFTDKLTSARFLVKNKGSLKLCVKDLVILEKEVTQGLALNI